MSERVSSSQNAVDVLDREANRMEQLSFSLFAIRS